MITASVPVTPEMDKWRDCFRKGGDVLTAFLEWLDDDGTVLADYDQDGRLQLTHEAGEGLVARFFAIDHQKMQEERRALLEYARGARGDD